MCTQNQLNIISNKVAKEAKRLLGDKLDAIVLYGSYARGDYDDESDIDIMVRVRCSKNEIRDYKMIFIDTGSDLSLEHDVTVSIIVYDTETFERYKNYLPFFENVEKEGVRIA